MKALQDKLTELGYPWSSAGKLDDADTSISESTSGAQPNGFSVTVEDENAEAFIGSLVNFTLDDWKRSFVESYLSESTDFFSAEEVEYLTLLTAYAVQHGEETSLPGIREALFELEDSLYSAYHAALASGWINVDTIMQFRARDYIKLLQQTARDMIDQFLSDREYEEFVIMLRYLLDSNPPSTETLHVFCTDERVWICDDSGELYRDAEVERAARMAMGDEEVNPEDLTMSILVTKSPCHIVIHDLTNSAPWPSFAETCERVFLQRAERCNHCSMCQTLVEGHSFS